jgi:hypothetical protein
MDELEDEDDGIEDGVFGHGYGGDDDEGRLRIRNV